ncbi:ABC transporter related protein [Desulfovibrio sp. X2]|uniref:ABC transporter ATP-binding protein n=1 Tax=Desulfovibrio sp. X2 TaxID=941449 RepID=UPI000358E3E6|nr:ABC transporter ATP-binding protein [Desulfovibrio sp. X2]EPR37137.1 ABC transporter related protein [Desulfovibrio sp. X2]
MHPTDVAIRAENLSKVYKLYSSPFQLLVDKLGLGRFLRQAPGQHAALNSVSLDIRRGEKVAIIGRNGAGKSTFLKLVSGVSEPSSGTLDVNGKIHALLSIGSGFHQDFTGRQNVYAYLANQGVAGKEADSMVEEIIEFAEIEDYIDQPLRTYSTGMGVRLMFAASTVVVPDILILDEVLGVGDAYFAQKSYDRMQDMARKQGTTLLMVTHDIYSAIRLCERVVWIDRGRVIMDGKSKEVVAAYENSVKLQEEERLRIKSLRKKVAPAPLSPGGTAATQGPLSGPTVLVEIKPGNGMYFEAPFALSEVALFAGEERIAVWEADAAEAEQALIAEGSQWGGLVEENGVRAVRVKDHGNIFQKAALALSLESGSVPSDTPLRLGLAVTAPRPVSITTNLRADGIFLSSVPTEAGKLSGHREQMLFDLQPDEAQVSDGKNTGFAGTADIVLHEIKLVQNGRQTLVCESGVPFEIHAEYEIKNPDLAKEFELLVGIHADGVREICRVFAGHQRTPERKLGKLSIPMSDISLGNGEYSLSIAVAKSGYYEDEREIFYSINHDLYCCYIRHINTTMIGSSTFLKNPVLVYRANIISDQ